MTTLNPISTRELNQMSHTDLVKEYAPYDTHEAFGEGYAAYGFHSYGNPYDGQPSKGVAAQAWDRGFECAARATRAGIYIA